MSIILKEIRNSYNLTQTELAEKLNVSRSAIAQIESGKNNISLDLAKRISEIFSVPITRIINNEESLIIDNEEVKLALNNPSFWERMAENIAFKIRERFDKIEMIKLLISKIAKEKNLKEVTLRFDEFCNEYNFNAKKKDFFENGLKNAKKKDIEKLFNITEYGKIALLNDLSSMLFFEYDIPKEFLKTQYGN